MSNKDNRNLNIALIAFIAVSVLLILVMEYV